VDEAVHFCQLRDVSQGHGCILREWGHEGLQLMRVQGGTGSCHPLPAPVVVSVVAGCLGIQAWQGLPVGKQARADISDEPLFPLSQTATDGQTKPPPPSHFSLSLWERPGLSPCPDAPEEGGSLSTSYRISFRCSSLSPAASLHHLHSS